MENLNWLKQESPQIILFRNEKWYKKGGVFHNVNGPAIKALNGNSSDKFYIKGELLEYGEWENKSLVIRRKRKIKKLPN